MHLSRLEDLPVLHTRTNRLGGHTAKVFRRTGLPLGANDGPTLLFRKAVQESLTPLPDVNIRAYPLKRGVDIVGSLTLLIFLGPLMLLTALIIRALDPGPVLFAQERVGALGVRFKVLKFRTMRGDADSALAKLLSTDIAARREWMASQKLVKDPRVTLIGSFLRRSSIDELPQLFNILKGEMSLVGPRPIVPDESERYGRHIRSYRSVKPGLTGLWQVSGRNNTTYARRVALDVAYSRKIGLLLDVRILLATIPAVLASEGCY